MANLAIFGLYYLCLSFVFFLNALNKHSVSASLKTNATNRKLNFMQMQTIPIHRIFFLFKHYLTTSLSFSFCVINLVKGSKADIRRMYFFCSRFCACNMFCHNRHLFPKLMCFICKFQSVSHNSLGFYFEKKKL